MAATAGGITAQVFQDTHPREGESVSPLFTVFTPTYQRAALLKRAYASLLSQEDQDFEWVVVDDGSTDETRSLLSTWQQAGALDLRWEWQTNSGKQRAINRAVKLARGELFVVLDSDDWLASDALGTLRARWEEIDEEKRGQYKGLVALFADPQGRVIGPLFPRDGLVTNSVELKYMYGIVGDHFGVTRTEVLREFPFPEWVAGYQPESLIWNRIARRYPQVCINEVVAYKDYQPTGLSSAGLPSRIRAAPVWRLRYQELLQHDSLPLRTQIWTGANFVRFGLHEGLAPADLLQYAGGLGKWMLGAPMGIAAWLRDVRDSDHK